MNISKHLKIAGVLQVIQGIMMLLFGLYGVFGNFFNPWADSPEWEFSKSTRIILMLTLIFLFGGIQTWFGFSLARQRQWTTRVGGFICCVLGFFSFPPVFSLYAFVVLLLVNKAKTRVTEPPLSP
jgi:hypothetical protein